jgi:hypothetical protein
MNSLKDATKGTGMNSFIFSHTTIIQIGDRYYFMRFKMII